MVKFAKFSVEEQESVNAIIDRALPKLRAVGIGMTNLELSMDLSAVHALNPLRLAELSKADDMNFSHDIAGIVGYLDRKTGKLRNFFVPRYSMS